MAFQSLFFVFMVLPVMLFLYYGLLRRWQNGLLILFSLFLYAWGDPYGVVLLLVISFVNYGCLKIWHTRIKKYKTLFLAEIVLFNLFFLFYFKYYFVALEEVNSFMALPSYQIFGMPLGMSYYIFSILSFLLDSKEDTTLVEVNWKEYLLYVTFFPKLFMGPITRYETMRKDIQKRECSFALFSNGARRLIIGLAQKVILADAFAGLFASLQVLSPSFVGSWIMTIVFALQIYFDFCGYSHIAIGLANLFGFHLPENFHYPYLSTSLKQFWGRWHITLGVFFKKYLYIPLGGSRKGKARHIFALLCVWLATGMWHGSQLHFILWGLYFGVMVIFEKYIWCHVQKHCPKVINWLFTLIIVLIGWVLFYCDTQQILPTLQSMTDLSVLANDTVWYYIQSYGMYLLIGIFAVTPCFNSVELLCNHYMNRFYYLFATALYFILFMITIAFMVSNTYEAFLYSAF